MNETLKRMHYGFDQCNQAVVGTFGQLHRRYQMAYYLFGLWYAGKC